MEELLGYLWDFIFGNPHGVQMATGLGIASVALGAGSMAIGLSGAAKQRKAAKKAERESKLLMQEAKVLATKDFYEGVSVPLDAYDKQFRENTAQQMQGVQALQEAGGRSLAAGIGKVAGQGVAANSQTQDAMAQALYENDLLKAQSATAVNSELVDATIGEASDMSGRASDARLAASGSMEQAITGLSSTLESASGLVPAWGAAREARLADKLAKKHGGLFLNDQGKNYKTNNLDSITERITRQGGSAKDLKRYLNMSPEDFKALDPSELFPIKTK
jgi:hypothetical protein